MSCSLFVYPVFFWFFLSKQLVLFVEKYYNNSVLLCFFLVKTFGDKQLK